MSAQDAPANRLAGESSPYLLLHAHNPVDWYPWGDEAFARARREDKPIFLSVGYSTCHWCHVMERESFANDEIARQLNAGFVSIKLDREERPELDEIYMLATQLLTQSGGWPNSVFLTHDLKPFFAGTYYPPEDRWGRPGFPRVLAALRDAWEQRRADVEAQAEALADAIRAQLAERPAAARQPAPGVVPALEASLARRFDPEWGGFGPAPKFPSPSNLEFLRDRMRAAERPEASDAARLLAVTLDHMARGGLFDQLAGGFHRYSTDAEWLVPHFEKMLYDNAGLAPLYAEAALLLRRGDFARVARATLAFVERELVGPHGGFLSAIDADTDGEEGAYYTFTGAELRAALDDAQHALLAPIYGFDGPPNFERTRYVLHLPEPLEAQARALGLTLDALLERLEPGRAALLAVRAARPRPLTDDKVLADWNGLMIAGAARAGRLLAEPAAVALAARAADFVLARLRGADGRLLHSFRGEAARIPAFLDDYAFLIHGLLALREATGEARWRDEALRLQAELDQRLWDAAGGGYFQAEPHPHLLVRSKSGTDGALPSGNGIAALNLLALHALTGEREWRDRAERVVAAFGAAIEQFPLAHVTLVRARAALGAEEATGEQPVRAAGALEALADEVVRVEAALEPATDVRGPRHARVELHVAEGWHVNAHAPGEAHLVPTRIEGPAVVAVAYPPAERLDQAPSEPLEVYRGRVLARVELAGDAGTAPELTITYQPCDDRRCLPPVTRRVRVAPAA